MVQETEYRLKSKSFRLVVFARSRADVESVIESLQSAHPEEFLVEWEKGGQTKSETYKVLEDGFWS